MAVGMLPGNLEKTSHILKKYVADLEFEITIEVRGDYPSLYINRELLKKLAQLGAEIDIDMY